MHGIKPKPIVHRDIRWPNIVRYQDEYQQFILIDFDYATFGSGTKGNIKKALDGVSKDEHAPEMLIGKHSVKVDMWSVGYLITSCGIDNIPSKLKGLAKKLTDNPKKRPSASDARDEVIEIFKEVYPKDNWLEKVEV